MTYWIEEKIRLTVILAANAAAFALACFAVPLLGGMIFVAEWFAEGPAQARAGWGEVTAVLVHLASDVKDTFDELRSAE